MKTKLSILCGALALLLYGQTQSTPDPTRACLPLGNSGALACQEGRLDIVTSEVPLIHSANHFAGANTFESGLQLDSQHKQHECSEELRGTLWFKKDEMKDSMQVCIREGAKFRWADVEMHAGQ